MRILVISLLRLGDFLQIAPVLKGLEDKYPRAVIDVLTHKPVAQLHPMMPIIRKWWTLDRDELQAGLGRADIPLLTSYDVLKEQLEKISAENYDLIINLTQTQFSGWIAGYLNAKEKLGLSFDARGRALFHSPWFRYLDSHAQVNSPDIFNYTDIFYQACGLGNTEKVWPLKTTEKGKREVDALGLSAQPTLVCQMFTSDEKKNWGEGAWTEFLVRVRASHPDWQIVLLGSPQEETRVEEIRMRSDVGARTAILSLDGALELLRRSHLLVSGDTSIKHLAGASKIRVLELSLGSSDYLRTGSYRSDSLILQPQLACSPCPHSGSCSQITHACADKLKSSLVAEAAGHVMAGAWDKLHNQAHAHTGIRFLRTRHLETGFWFAADLSSERSLQTVESLLERCTLKFVLNQEFKRPLAEFGSETVRLENEIQRLLPTGNRQPLLAHLDFLEKQVSRVEQSARHSLEIFPREQAGMDFDLGRVREAQARMEQDARQAEIKVKLIRSLKSRLMENT